jgi:hypothetical protein
MCVVGKTPYFAVTIAPIEMFPTTEPENLQNLKTA